jgi:hypothetical protein
MSVSIVNTYQATPSNPSGSNSGLAVMMGLAGSIKPKRGRIIFIMISGNVHNSTGADGAKMFIGYGTGVAPVNGGAVSGTAVGSTLVMTNATAANNKIPFSIHGVVTGLTVGTTYWIDLALGTITGGTAFATNISISVFER